MGHGSSQTVELPRAPRKHKQTIHGFKIQEQQ